MTVTRNSHVFRNRGQGHRNVACAGDDQMRRAGLHFDKHGKAPVCLFIIEMLVLLACNRQPRIAEYSLVPLAQTQFDLRAPVKQRTDDRISSDSLRKRTFPRRDGNESHSLSLVNRFNKRVERVFLHLFQ